MKYFILKCLFTFQILLNTIKAYIKFNTEFTFLSSTKFFPVEKNTCTEIIIPNNYKTLNVSVDSSSISSILLTDSKITHCDSSLSSCCPMNSTFCLQTINPTHDDFDLYYCLDYSYLYACNDNSLSSVVTITTNVVEGDGCQTAEFTDETECAIMGIQNCKDQTKCNKNCQYVECLTSQEKKILSLCLPVNFSMSDVVGRCENHRDFNIDGKGGKVNILQCEKENGSDKSSNKIGHKIIKGLAIVIGMLGLGLFMTSIYYRFKTAMDVNRPPFNPPWFCPNFIFPRVYPSLQ